MNTIFTGSFKRDGLIYDFSGLWSPSGARVSWKAIVRNADVVCRPSGELDSGLNDDEILDEIRLVIERETDEVLARSRSA